MKKVLRSLMILIFTLTISCTASKNLKHEQILLHQTFINYFQDVINNVEDSGNIFITFFEKAYNPNKSCDNHKSPNAITSIYIPKSATINYKLNCLIEATATLENAWKIFDDKNDYISWLYVYDNETKGLRIYPATNTTSIFGDDLTFDSFYFFKGAIEKYPNASWTGIKEDINGTGKILIYSKAVLLPGNSRYSVLGIDVRTHPLLKKYYGQLLNLALVHGSRHVFAFSYTNLNNKREFAHEYSTNPAIWKLLNSSKNHFLNLTQKQTEQFLSLETSANKIPLKIQPSFLKIGDNKYYCSLSKISIPELFTLICSQL